VLELKKLKHLFIIPDGNRRFANKMGIPLSKAYKMAADTAYNLVNWVLVDNDVDEYTFFSLSYANVISRKKEWLEPILRAQAYAFERAATDRIFHDYGIKIEATGNKTILPLYYQSAIKKAEEATVDHKSKIFRPLVAYSGILDLEQSVKKILQNNETPTAKNMEKNCMVNSPIDFVIRTAGEKRLSDSPFLPLKYAEFYFIDKLLPELTREDIDNVIAEYYKRKRTYGG
jgi:undecaprenyl diphosphate synthase